MLEIGCGWGGFAIHAAQNYGCKVLGITISQEQLALARARIAAAGLERQVEVALLDYRHAAGVFDKIVSIEMFEAVGAEYFETFMQKCDSLLRPGGRLVMQTISVPDRTFQALRDGVNWLQKYIFPGGMLPSLAQIDVSIRRTGLVISDVEDIAEHYVRTLREWRQRFFANIEAVSALRLRRALRAHVGVLPVLRGGRLRDALHGRPPGGAGEAVGARLIPPSPFHNGEGAQSLRRCPQGRGDALLRDQARPALLITP